MLCWRVFRVRGEIQNYMIETRGLTRRFGTQLAVDDLNLLAPEARVYGFLGPNGAGKTTASLLVAVAGCFELAWRDVA